MSIWGTGTPYVDSRKYITRSGSSGGSDSLTDAFFQNEAHDLIQSLVESHLKNPSISLDELQLFVNKEVNRVNRAYSEASGRVSARMAREGHDAGLAQGTWESMESRRIGDVSKVGRDAKIEYHKMKRADEKAAIAQASQWLEQNLGFATSLSELTSQGFPKGVGLPSGMMRPTRSRKQMGFQGQIGFGAGGDGRWVKSKPKNAFVEGNPWLPPVGGGGTWHGGLPDE